MPEGLKWGQPTTVPFWLKWKVQEEGDLWIPSAGCKMMELLMLRQAPGHLMAQVREELGPEIFWGKMQEFLTRPEAIRTWEKFVRIFMTLRTHRNRYAGAGWMLARHSTPALRRVSKAYEEHLWRLPQEEREYPPPPDESDGQSLHDYTYLSHEMQNQEGWREGREVWICFKVTPRESYMRLRYEEMMRLVEEENRPIEPLQEWERGELDWHMIQRQLMTPGEENEENRSLQQLARTGYTSTPGRVLDRGFPDHPPRPYPRHPSSSSNSVPPGTQFTTVVIDTPQRRNNLPSDQT